jgi:hypothetical protein
LLFYSVLTFIVQFTSRWSHLLWVCSSCRAVFDFLFTLPIVSPPQVREA